MGLGAPLPPLVPLEGGGKWATGRPLLPPFGEVYLLSAMGLVASGRGLWRAQHSAMQAPCARGSEPARATVQGSGRDSVASTAYGRASSMCLSQRASSVCLRHRASSARRPAGPASVASSSSPHGAEPGRLPATPGAAVSLPGTATMRAASRRRGGGVAFADTSYRCACVSHLSPVSDTRV